MAELVLILWIAVTSWLLWGAPGVARASKGWGEAHAVIGMVSFVAAVAVWVVLVWR